MFIYRAERQIIYDKYEAKRVVNRKIKARERELVKNMQKDYDVIASIYNMWSQLKRDVKSLSSFLVISERVFD